MSVQLDDTLIQALLCPLSRSEYVSYDTCLAILG
jgi:hypothetical protein